MKLSKTQQLRDQAGRAWIAGDIERAKEIEARVLIRELSASRDGLHGKKRFQAPKGWGRKI